MGEKLRTDVGVIQRLDNFLWVIRHRTYSTLGYIFVRTWCRHLISNMAYYFFKVLEETESFCFAWRMTWHPKYYRVNKKGYDEAGY